MGAQGLEARGQQSTCSLLFITNIGLYILPSSFQGLEAAGLGLDNEKKTISSRWGKVQKKVDRMTHAAGSLRNISSKVKENNLFNTFILPF